MTDPARYDVVIIGGGAMGLAATYEIAKAGKRALVLEKSNFFNQSGSSGDIMRMYRTMYTEGFMADLAKKSLDIWDELEQDAGDGNLRLMSGLLNFGDLKYGGDSPEGTLLGPIDNLDRLEMSYKILDAGEIKKRYPFKGLKDDWIGLLAPDNGCINVPLLLRTLYRLSYDYGATLRQHTPVEKMVPAQNGSSWEVHARDRDGKEIVYHTEKIVIACGAYTNHVVSPSFDIHLNLNIWEMTATYFNISPGPKGTSFPSMWFQFAEDKDGRSQLFYGFPAVPWGQSNLARISVDAATRQITDPKDRQSSVVNSDDVEDTRQWVEDHVVGADATSPACALTCLQTNVFDNMFVLDYIPDHYLKGGPSKSVAIFTAGWAMKFTPLLGRALKEMVLDEGSEYALRQFSIERKSEDGKGSFISLGPKVFAMKSQDSHQQRPSNSGGSSRHSQRATL